MKAASNGSNGGDIAEPTDLLVSALIQESPSRASVPYGSDAASSKVKEAGFLAAKYEGTVTISWNARARLPVLQMLKTSSPGTKSLTDSPTESTIPAASLPSTVGQDSTFSPKSRLFQSIGFKATALMRMHISSGPGEGYGTEAVINGPPCLESWY